MTEVCLKVPQACSHAFDSVCLVRLHSPACHNSKHGEVCLGVSLLVNISSRFQGYSVVSGLQAARCRSLCTGEIKPEGFVHLTVCLSGAVCSMTKHVVTAVLVVSAAWMDGCLVCASGRRFEAAGKRGERDDDGFDLGVNFTCEGGSAPSGLGASYCPKRKSSSIL